MILIEPKFFYKMSPKELKIFFSRSTSKIRQKKFFRQKVTPRPISNFFFSKIFHFLTKRPFLSYFWCWSRSDTRKILRNRVEPDPKHSLTEQTKSIFSKQLKRHLQIIEHNIFVQMKLIRTHPLSKIQSRKWW